jgi:hypothetical protein
VSRSTGAAWKTESGGIVIEYVKSRGVLRLRGGYETSDASEVSLDEFCRSLGIDVTKVAPPRGYLLFAGLDVGDGHSPRHVVESFTSEADAVQAFRTLRLRHIGPDDWAEAVSLDAGGRLRALCWFGTPWGPRGRNGSGSTGELVGAAPRRSARTWRRRSGR